ARRAATSSAVLVTISSPSVPANGISSRMASVSPCSIASSPCAPAAGLCQRSAVGRRRGKKDGRISGNHVIDASPDGRHSGVVTGRQVVILAFEDMQPLDVVGPHEVFHGATQALQAEDRPGGYSVMVASLGGGPVRSESGLELATAPLPQPGVSIDTLVLPGGHGSRAAAAQPALLEWVGQMASRSRRVATVCSGTFIAAEAGLLDGRRATTHWARAEELRAAYPAVTVDADPIYLSDGKYWSSAGVTAGI